MQPSTVVTPGAVQDTSRSCAPWASIQFLPSTSSQVSEADCVGPASLGGTEVGGGIRGSGLLVGDCGVGATGSGVGGGICLGGGMNGRVGGGGRYDGGGGGGSRYDGGGVGGGGGEGGGGSVDAGDGDDDTGGGVLAKSSEAGRFLSDGGGAGGSWLASMIAGATDDAGCSSEARAVTAASKCSFGVIPKDTCGLPTRNQPAPPQRNPVKKAVFMDLEQDPDCLAPASSSSSVFSLLSSCRFIALRRSVDLCAPRGNTPPD